MFHAQILFLVLNICNRNPQIYVKEFAFFIEKNVLLKQTILCRKKKIYLGIGLLQGSLKSFTHTNVVEFVNGKQFVNADWYIKVTTYIYIFDENR